MLKTIGIGTVITGGLVVGLSSMSRQSVWVFIGIVLIVVGFSWVRLSLETARSMTPSERLKH